MLMQALAQTVTFGRQLAVHKVISEVIVIFEAYEQNKTVLGTLCFYDEMDWYCGEHFTLFTLPLSCCVGQLCDRVPS